MSKKKAVPEQGPEILLLQQCAVPFFTPSRQDSIRKLAPRVPDWDRLTALSIRHSVLPLVHEHIQRAGPAGVPPDKLENLRILSYKCAARNAALLSELNRIMDLLKDAGLQAVPVKGPLLAISCYGDLNRRRFDDLDLLLSKQDIPKAREVLQQAGYRSLVNLRPAQLKAFIRAGWDVNLRKGEEEYSVDLSTGITPGFFCFRLSSRIIAENMTALEYQGRSYPAIVPELLLVMLAAHGAYHRWERLIWAADVRCVIETHPGMDTAKLLSLARHLGAMRMVELALLVADRLEPLPGRFRAIMPDTGTANRLSQTAAGKIRYHLANRERWRDKVCYLLKYFCAPTFSDWNTAPLPGWMNWLYYVIRPFRILFRGIKKPAQ